PFALGSVRRRCEMTEVAFDLEASGGSVEAMLSLAGSVMRKILLGAASQPEALQAAVKRAAAQAQFFSRAADVAVTLGEGPLDQKALDLFEAHVFEPAGRLLAGLQPEVARLDDRARRH